MRTHRVDAKWRRRRVRALVSALVGVVIVAACLAALAASAGGCAATVQAVRHVLAADSGGSSPGAPSPWTHGVDALIEAGLELAKDFGIPGAGVGLGVFGLVARRRGRRAARESEAETRRKDTLLEALVTSVQAGRKQLHPFERERMDRVLYEKQKETPGLIDEVRAIKQAMPKEEPRPRTPGQATDLRPQAPGAETATAAVEAELGKFPAAAGGKDLAE